MQPTADDSNGVHTFLAIVAAQVGFDLCRGPVETVKRGEVYAVLGAIGLAFRLVPVPHLYAYIKCQARGSVGWEGLRGRVRSLRPVAG